MAQSSKSDRDARRSVEHMKNKVRAARVLAAHREAILLAAITYIEGGDDMKPLKDSVTRYRQAVEEFERM